jgi:phosphatidylserine/phosphatidylglycerophosphate/cardiolipin synthase-like enzyme
MRKRCAARRGGRGDLLRAGVAIHEFQPTMFHCKVLVVDGCGFRGFDELRHASLT